MVDLNTLIPPGSSLQLTFAFAINDAGQIAGTGLPSGCAPQDIEFCGHAYVLIPTGKHNSEITTAVSQGNPASVTQRPTAAIKPAPNKRAAPFRAHPFRGYPIPRGGA